MNRYFYGGDVRQHFISIEKSQLHVVATPLDPRLGKNVFFTKRSWSDRVIADSVGCSSTNRNQQKPKKGKNLLWKDQMKKPLIENIIKQTVILPRLSTLRFWMRKAVAPATIHLNQKKIHMSEQNRWWPRAWMSRIVKATFVHYRCRWDSARDIQKMQQ